MISGEIAAQQTDLNPDEVAEASRLSRISGLPPELINDNLPEVRNTLRGRFARDIVDNNPILSKYIATHPFTSAIASDDWDNLDKLTKEVTGLSLGMRILNIGPETAKEAVEGFEEGFGTDLSWTKRYGIGWYPFEIAAKLGSGLFGGTLGYIHGLSKSIYQAVSPSENEAERFATDITGFAEAEMARGSNLEYLVGARIPLTAARQLGIIGKGAEAAERYQQWIQAYEAARPWLREGLTPPRGLHPVLDEHLAGVNAAWVEKLERGLEAAQKSGMRARDPEELKKILDIMDMRDSHIGIHGDAVVRLYEGKVPAPDDGLLGWVPGIESKLELARQTGADVMVPTEDWIAHADPALAKALREDIRIWPGGVTAREAAEPIEPKALIDSPLAQVKGTAGLEPLFAVGDRKLTLQPVKGEFEDWARQYGIDLAQEDELSRDVYKDLYERYRASGDELQILDEHGTPVGRMNIFPDAEKKQLYINSIEGLNGHGPGSFGPALMMDLLRQLKALYPDYETLSGLRVTGARPEPAEPKIKLSTSFDSVRESQPIFEGAWHRVGTWVEAQLPKLTPEWQKIADEIEAELRQTVGHGVKIVPTAKIRAAGTEPLGAFVPHWDRMPHILYNIFEPSSLGIARHEGIHFLRRYGLINEDEWSVLQSAAVRNGWLQKYEIFSRYRDLDYEGQLEEAIAEAYREWRAGFQVPGAVEKIFQKLKEFWDRLRGRFDGVNPEWETVFKAIAEGKFKNRALAPIREGYWKPAFALDKDIPWPTPPAAGLNKKSFEKLQENIRKTYRENLKRAEERAKREQERRQSEKWKRDRASVRQEVEKEIRQRPDVAADLLVASGELGGQKLRARYPLLKSDLTEEQRKALPRHYYSENGIPIDIAARMLGFHSGDAMVDALANYVRDKSGTAQEYLREIVEKETDRRMEETYGKLEENIMDAAKDQALSEASINTLIEEYLAAGMLAGQPTIDKAALLAAVREQIGKQPIGTLKSITFLRQAQRHDKEAQEYLLAGKHLEALKSLERRVYTAIAAAEVRKAEKEIGQFDRAARRLGKKHIESIAPEYLNYIHHILRQIGKPTYEDLANIRSKIENRTGQTLQEFVQDKQLNLRAVPVMQDLFDPDWKKPYLKLTLDEFRAIRDTIKTLEENGRDELKVYRAGEAASLSLVKQEIISELARFKTLEYGPGEERVGVAKYLKPLRRVLYSTLVVETIFNRIDRYNPHGPLFQYVIRDLSNSAAREDARRKAVAKLLKEARDNEDLTRAVENPIFRDPSSKNLFSLNRGHLRAVMLNMGTESNLEKLAKGYGLNPVDVEKWVHRWANRKDWEFVEKIWNIFEDLKKDSDKMYASLTGGVEAENIPGRIIKSPFRDIQGKYYPIIHESEFEGEPLAYQKKIMQPGFVSALPSAGYTKERTRDIRPVSLELDMLPYRLAQEIHDIEMRPALINASKILMDKDILKAFKAKYGTEVRDMLLPYLQDIANKRNFNSKAQAEMSRWAEFFRQNLVSTLVGLNIGTVFKHGLTAWVQSMQEVGGLNFLKAVKTMFSMNPAIGERNWQFAMNSSVELQRRIQHYEETLTGTTTALQQKGRFQELRHKVIEFAAWPVAKFDLLSSVPTWLASYEKEILAGYSHGDAVAVADRAVKRAHGSTNVTNLPEIMRDPKHRWFTSVYSFFNHIMNRQAELIWRAGETLQLARGDKVAAMKEIPKLTSMLFAYVIWPAIVEEIFSPMRESEDESFVTHWAKALTYTLANSWVYVRDFAHYVVNGGEPSVGIMSTAYRQAANVYRDIGGIVSGDRPMTEENAHRIIEDAAQLTGLLTGFVPSGASKPLTFALGVGLGGEQPEGPWSWLVGLRYGTLKGHSKTWEGYWEGRNE